MENVRTGIVRSIVFGLKVLSPRPPKGANERVTEAALTGEDLKKYREVVGASSYGNIKDVNQLNEIYAREENEKGTKNGKGLNPIATMRSRKKPVKSTLVNQEPVNQIPDAERGE